jgi:multidrug efflux system outer membrane protein
LKRAALLLCGAAWLAGCTSLAPEPAQPQADLPAAWASASAPSEGGVAVADIDWQAFITDMRLREVVTRAVANNRDLRATAANIERARALYRVERAALLPTLTLTGAAAHQGQPAQHEYGVQLGLAQYELDFFGRLQNLSDAALQNFFAVQENRRSAQISLIAETSTAWLTMAADAERLRLARETLRSQRASYDLTRQARQLGGASELTLTEAQTTVDAARVDVARYMALVAQDRNLLELLAGGRLDDALLPADKPPDGNASRLVDVPPGLPSDVLQHRPDVRAAEHALRAAEADIGAARAAFYPSITLTAGAGVQSASLSALFDGGTRAWSFLPQIDLPIFDAGRRRANLQVSEADRQIALAQYEKTLQAAFREVADALATRATLSEQLAAQQSLTDATGRRYDLSDVLYKNGASSYLDVLDAQRSLYTARQNLIGLRLTEQLNRVALYRALGGG